MANSERALPVIGTLVRRSVIYDDNVVNDGSPTLRKPPPRQTGRLNRSLSAFSGSARQPEWMVFHILAADISVSYMFWLQINPDGWLVVSLPLKLHMAQDNAQTFHLE